MARIPPTAVRAVMSEIQTKRWMRAKPASRGRPALVAVLSKNRFLLRRRRFLAGLKRLLMTMIMVGTPHVKRFL